ncbi:hypothetical protein ALC62_06781 [Cyphomyrmex costatus]|uniref:Uncharacterized protein n=1 Tax=Cyphomyrmex costatus TaxID=456900 RepID=A0A195CNV9_9HYME|nr:hypothetical protein ALC62_06781 [Cyphomyrmex costatus]
MNPSQDVESKAGTSTFSSGRFLNRRIAASYSKGVHFEPLREDKGGEERGERVQRHCMVVARKAGNNDDDDDDVDGEENEEVEAADGAEERARPRPGEIMIMPADVSGP